ncbi:MBL fold metallo-hydrolase [Treponema sp.]
MANDFIQLSPVVAYLPGGANIGLFDGPSGSVLIDSGNNKDSARRILKAVNSYGRSLSAVALTHSNADHAGGAASLVERTGVPVYAQRMEAAFCVDPLLEPSFLWGGSPPAELRGRFFMAPSCAVEALPEPDRALAGALLPSLPLALSQAGIRCLALPGHFFGQLGFMNDEVLFAGDAVFGPAIIDKHPIFFVYEVATFLESLDRIASSGVRIVVPSHGEATEDMGGLVAANRRAIDRIADSVLSACAAGQSAEGALSLVSENFGIELDWAQYALIGSTIRSFLVYLRSLGQIEAIFEGNHLIWRRV